MELTDYMRRACRVRCLGPYFETDQRAGASARPLMASTLATGRTGEIRHPA
jgi:hypothetical protein